MNEPARTLVVFAMRVVFLFIATGAFARIVGAAEERNAERHAEGCQLIKIAEWAVRRGVAQPVVEGRINGNPVGMMIDTGSPRTVITRSMAIRLQLKSEATWHQVYGIGGTTTNERTLVDMHIGDASRKDWSMLVVDDHDFGAVGIFLGGDMIRHADIEFDLAHDVVRLFQPKNCQDVSLAYWAPEGARTVAIESADSDPRITFTVEVNGVALDGQLDSGAEQSVLALYRANALGVKASSTGVVAAGCIMGLGRGHTEAWYGPFDTVAIGDERIRNPRLFFADIWASFPQRFDYRPDILLGADFLRAHRVLVARSQRRLYFTYAEGTIFPVGPAGACPAPTNNNSGSN